MDIYKLTGVTLVLLGLYILWKGIEQIQFALKGYGRRGWKARTDQSLSKVLYKPEKATKRQKENLWMHGIRMILVGVGTFGLGIHFLFAIN